MYAHAKLGTAKFSVFLPNKTETYHCNKKWKNVITIYTKVRSQCLPKILHTIISETGYGLHLSNECFFLLEYTASTAALRL